MKKVKNYARFYTLIKSVQVDDKDELKESLVSQFSGGRTTSIREMAQREYDAMCDSIDPKVEKKMRDQLMLKGKRSAALKRMQKLGVDTSSWDKVDQFCLDSRISGKRFYDLTIDELTALIPKLVAISKKPRKVAVTAPKPQKMYMVLSTNQPIS